MFSCLAWLFDSFAGSFLEDLTATWFNGAIWTTLWSFLTGTPS